MVAHNVVRILGGLPGGEVWSVTPKFIPNFGDPVTAYEDLEAWATAIAARETGQVIPAPLRVALTTAGSIQAIRTEYLDANHRLVQAAEVTLPTPVTGSGSATKPFQTALVTSLRTGRPGRSARGRLYWPALGTSIDSGTLRISVATRGTFIGGMLTFLKGLEDSAPAETPLTLAVVSQTTNSALAVSSLSVGDVLDTQRRRRDSAVEQYTTVPFP